MLRNLMELLDVETIFGLLAASGGMARILTGTNKDSKVSMLGEAGRILFVAMPIGILAGCWIQSVSSSEILPFAASFTAGVVSLNIVRFLVSPEGFALLRQIIGGRNEK